MNDDVDIEIQLEKELENKVEKVYDGNVIKIDFSNKNKGVSMSRHEDYMKAMIEQEELRMAQAKKQSDNVVDMVNSPPHYNQTGIECIHAISAATDTGFKYYLQGNIMKYLWRFDYKDKPLEDLQKAKWYLDKLIEEVMASDKS